MIMDMAFLQTLDVEIAVGVAVAIVMSAIFVLSFRKPKGCLDPENFKEFKLVKCVQLSHNVAKFTFALPTPTSVLGLPIGQHISCKGKDSQGEDVIKPYTPTTLDSDVGHFELVIKDECPIIFERCVLVIIFLLKDPRDVLDINMARLEHLVCLLEDLELLQCSKLLEQYWKTQKTGRRFTSSMPMLNMRTLF